MKILIRSTAALIALFLLTVGAHAVTWYPICDPDPGSIKRISGGYTFSTSPNRCSGGIFNQRAEIITDGFSTSRQVTYVFDTTMAMTSNQNENFDWFHVADGRLGCAPPLSIRWGSNGRLSFGSDYTRDQGMNGCVENRAMRDARYSGPTLKRDGTPYRIQVQVAFDGAGGFTALVVIDGQAVIQGAYSPPTDPQFVASPEFRIKHGVYSRNMFDYTMVSAGMKLNQAR